MSESKTPASDRSKAACYAFQKGECERGDACRFSHESPAGKGGKGAKAGKGGKGGKGVQTPVNLGEATIMTELKKPESMESTGSLVFFVITNNGRNVYQAGVRKYQADAFKGGSTLGGGCHVHMILRHEGLNYVVVYNNNCCLHPSAGITCRIPKCTYIHEPPGTVMSDLPLVSPASTALPANWLRRENLQTLVSQAIYGVSSTLDFTEGQTATINRLKQDDAAASTAARRGVVQQQITKRVLQLAVEEDVKDLEAVNVGKMSLDEIRTYQVLHPLSVATKRQRTHRVANRQQYPRAAETAAPIAEGLAAPSQQCQSQGCLLHRTWQCKQ